jgi:glycine/D-amino acid oxidase-like deaminating enzyme
MRKQLRVTKADGTIEAYLHTKVIGTINNALAAAGQADTAVSEDLAEAVTFYLYSKQGRRTVSSNEVFSMIKAVLVATGYETAALALSKHAFERRLRRARTEVLDVDMHEFADAEKLCRAKQPPARTPWDKTRIVHDLTTRFGVQRQTARTVASIVEERIFRMEITIIPLSLIKQLVLGEAAAILRAEKELQMV